MTTPTDPIPEFKWGAERYARREPVASREAPASQAVDRETREVVETFEALYAGLSSAGPEPAAGSAAQGSPTDDLLIDLPAELGGESPSPRAIPPRARESTPRLVAAGRASARTQSAASEVDSSLDIDDAFAMLRAAESKARDSAERDVIDREEAQNTTSARDAPAPARRSTRSRDRHTAYDVPAAAPEWAGKAHGMWAKIAGAAVVALIVGTGVGYMAGRMPDTVAPQAKIPVTPQGGARLQFDYELTPK